MDVTESDHKPVRCKFHSTIAHVDRSLRRKHLGKSYSLIGKLGLFLMNYVMFQKQLLAPIAYSLSKPGHVNPTNHQQM